MSLLYCCFFDTIGDGRVIVRRVLVSTLKAKRRLKRRFRMMAASQSATIFVEKRHPRVKDFETSSLMWFPNKDHAMGSPLGLHRHILFQFFICRFFDFSHFLSAGTFLINHQNSKKSLVQQEAKVKTEKCKQNKLVAERL